jgi:hypothetical protein
MNGLLEVVSETCYSNEFQPPVLSRTPDQPTDEIAYKLTRYPSQRIDAFTVGVPLDSPAKAAIARAGAVRPILRVADLTGQSLPVILLG